MFRLVGLVTTRLLGVMSLLVLVVVILLAPFGAVLTNPALGFGGGNLPYVSRSGVSGTEIAAGAQLLADHVYGPWANEYVSSMW